jgi:hypothetical protein
LKMRLRIALSALCLGFATNAMAAATLDTSVSSSTSPSLGKIVSGSGGVLTTFTVSPGGTVTHSGGNAVRVLNTSVSTPTLTISCNGNGNGANSCTKFSKIVVSFTGGVSSGSGRTGTLTGLTGSIATGAATITQINATSFQIVPTGGSFTNLQVVTVHIGMSMTFANSGSGLDVATVIPYTINSTAS